MRSIFGMSSDDMPPNVREGGNTTYQEGFRWRMDKYYIPVLM